MLWPAVDCVLGNQRTRQWSKDQRETQQFNTFWTFLADWLINSESDISTSDKKNGILIQSCVQGGSAAPPCVPLLHPLGQLYLPPSHAPGPAPGQVQHGSILRQPDKVSRLPSDICHPRNTFCEIIRKNATSELNSKYFLSKKYLISAKRQAVKYRLYFFNIHGWYLSFFWENKLTKYISAYLSIRRRRYNNWNKIFDIKDSTNT